MRVIELHISNFRSVGDKQTIRFRSAHAVLAGANNAGKTNLLSALDWVLHRYPFRIYPTSDDYFDESKSIEIEAIVGDVSSSEKSGLYALCSNQQQRGALGSKDDPRISLKLTATPLAPSDDEDEDSETPGKVGLEMSLWGFPVHRRVTDQRAKLVQHLTVSPHRRIDYELSTRTRGNQYGELMKGVLAESAQFADLERLLEDVNRKITDAFADEKDALLADARVVSFAEDIAFQLTEEDDPSELLRNLEIMVTEAGRKTKLGRVGTGLQSIVIIGMLELVLRAKTGDLKVFSVEEPDAFVHPHAIRRLATLLRRIANEPGAQVLLSTHSPALLTTLLPGDVVRVEKRDGQTKVFQASGALSEAGYTRNINQDSAEIFFSRRTILVEGATERFLLPPISELLQKDGKRLDYGESGTSVIDMGGKSSIVTYLKLLHEFSIEARAILDADFLGGPECKSLVKYLRGLGKAVDDSDHDKLRKSLLKLGIAVLKQGEIEDYVPVADIAQASGKSEADVSSTLARHKKTSDAFKEIFGMGKPYYAQALAAHFRERNNVPTDLGRVIVWTAS